jgi:hypothetical protein
MLIVFLLLGLLAPAASLAALPIDPAVGLWTAPSGETYDLSPLVGRDAVRAFSGGVFTFALARPTNEPCGRECAHLIVFFFVLFFFLASYAYQYKQSKPKPNNIHICICPADHDAAACLTTLGGLRLSTGRAETLRVQELPRALGDSGVVVSYSGGALCPGMGLKGLSTMPHSPGAATATAALPVAAAVTSGTSNRRRTVITFECDHTGSDAAPTSVGSAFDPCLTRVVWRSPMGCGARPRLSMGWWFVIAAALAATLYCGIGAMLKTPTGEAGLLALIPHAAFWRQVPGLVADGCVFLWALIRARMRGGREEGYVDVGSVDIDDGDMGV